MHCCVCFTLPICFHWDLFTAFEHISSLNTLGLGLSLYCVYSSRRCVCFKVLTKYVWSWCHLSVLPGLKGLCTCNVVWVTSSCHIRILGSMLAPSCPQHCINCIIRTLAMPRIKPLYAWAVLCCILCFPHKWDTSQAGFQRHWETWNSPTW